MKPVAQPSATNAIAENLKGWRDEHQGILNQISDGLKALERLEADRRQPQSDDRLRAIESDVQLERTKIARARHELQRAGERWSREIEKATRAAATQAEQRFNEWVETDYNVAARAYGASIRRGLALASGAGRPVPGFEHMRVVAAEPPERGTLNSLNLIGPKLLIPDLANWQAEPSAAALAAPVLDLKGALEELTSSVATDPAIKQRLRYDPACRFVAVKPYTARGIRYEPGAVIDAADLPAVNSRRLGILTTQNLIRTRS